MINFYTGDMIVDSSKAINVAGKDYNREEQKEILQRVLPAEYQAQLAPYKVACMDINAIAAVTVEQSEIVFIINTDILEYVDDVFDMSDEELEELGATREDVMRQFDLMMTHAFAHELTHVKQIRDGRMQICHDDMGHVIWEGERWPLADINNLLAQGVIDQYFNSPWEVEAFQAGFEAEVAKGYRESVESGFAEYREKLLANTQAMA